MRQGLAGARGRPAFTLPGLESLRLPGKGVSGVAESLGLTPFAIGVGSGNADQKAETREGNLQITNSDYRPGPVGFFGFWPVQLRIH
jgi:hypothetical protein